MQPKALQHLQHLRAFPRPTTINHRPPLEQRATSKADRRATFTPNRRFEGQRLPLGAFLLCSAERREPLDPSTDTSNEETEK